nr:alpha/beta hydrolase [Nocardia abscessus]
MAAALSSSFDVIRPDLPGFGLTGPRADRDYRIQTYAETVAAFLDSIGVSKASVVGDSLGGNIAWNFALDHQQRVDRLVLINATGCPGKSLPLALRLARNPIGRVLMRNLASRSATERNLRSAVGSRKSVVDDAMVDRVHAMLTRPGNQKAFIDFANTDQIDRTTEIPAIAAPTLVLRSVRRRTVLHARYTGQPRTDSSQRRPPAPRRRSGMGGQRATELFDSRGELAEEGKVMKYFVVPGETRHLGQATRAGLRGDFIECGDRITHYEMAGPDGGEVVVFAGSLTTPLFYWDQLAGELHSRGFRTVAYSPYGRGYSDRVDAAYDEALFVRQIADLPQRLDLAEPFHLVGASMGALVGMAFAQRQTDRIATFTLAGPAGLQPTPAGRHDEDRIEDRTDRRSRRRRRADRHRVGDRSDSPGLGGADHRQSREVVVIGVPVQRGPELTATVTNGPRSADPGEGGVSQPVIAEGGSVLGLAELSFCTRLDVGNPNAQSRSDTGRHALWTIEHSCDRCPNAEGLRSRRVYFVSPSSAAVSP